MEITDLVSCIERAVASFGENMQLATLYELRREGFSVSDSIVDPSALRRALQNAFGPVGYCLAERAIVEEVKKLLEPFGPRSCDLAEVLENARKVILSSDYDYLEAFQIEVSSKSGPA